MGYGEHCDDFNKMYIGQTGRSIKTIFKEHKNHNNISKVNPNFAEHLIGYDHKYTEITNNLEIIKV